MALYTKTVVVSNATDIPMDAQPGQWVRVGKERRSRRLVSSTNFGVVTVKATNGRVSTAAFRLGRGKAKTVVLSFKSRNPIYDRKNYMGSEEVK